MRANYMRLPAELQALINSVQCVVLDFDGVLTDNKVIIDQDGRESVVCDRSDSMGLKIIKELGFSVVILSSETNKVVTERARKLKVECYQGVVDKVSVLNEFMQDRGFQAQNLLYLGNDVNDSGCLSRVGLPCVVKDSHPDVMGLAAYVTHSPGGKGAVREICDILSSQPRFTSSSKQAS